MIILYDLVSFFMDTNQDKQQKEDKMNDSNAYKYEEIKEHFEDFIKDQDKEWIKENFEDLHHHAFNNDYYIIGTHQAKKWLGGKIKGIFPSFKQLLIITGINFSLYCRGPKLFEQLVIT